MDRVDREILSLVDRAYAPATHLAYQQGILAYQEFCSTVRIRSNLPTDQHVVARFVAHLSLLGRAAATAKNYLAGLSACHRVNGWPDPTDSFLVKTILRGMCRSSKTPDSRYPITLQRLEELLPSLASVCSNSYEVRLFKAAFSMAFFGFLRVSEMLGQRFTGGGGRGPLKLTSVKVELSKVTVNLSGSKTNQLGHVEVVQIEKESSPDLCPVKALQQFLLVHPGNSDFLFVHFNGAPLKRHQFQSVLKKAARILGWPKGGFSSHSFRIGAATSAAANGVPLENIMLKGRWKSAAVSGYIRPEWA